ncbi:methionyl-tRNA formyltransferase [Caulobacter sp. 17J65-9]|uniref:methionyl-tRNA formyltransferase n=1 Tax=Caulobacter sp. 17J65-9 TaxID=2709382 RepID=UPI0013CD1C7B|nr:methionyl-tRNA formyltransferase [Caulobacter sp. 17J65-9]NEX93429.1 methionyl-tRNA formyltransferase [Caulobacter sp. 17J65-9]
MRIAFMGTPEFAVRALAELVAAGHEIAAVYTQPPKPRGRGQQLAPSPVQAFAEGLGLPVRTPVSMRDPAEVEAFQALDLDVAVVVAYGQILKANVLDAPRLGCFNLHASLLPRWRGAAPIQRAIMAGDAATGVQVMRMTEGLDEGPIVLSEIVPISADDTSATLHDKLAMAGSSLLPRALAAIERGGATETEQAGEPTYARKITPAEARIDWARPAIEIDRHVRGLSPFPGAWFEAPSDKGPVRVKVLLTRLEPGSGTPGTLLDDGLKVAGAEGAVRLVKVQREGKGPQDAETFLRGFPLAVGTVLG